MNDNRARSVAAIALLTFAAPTFGAGSTLQHEWQFEAGVPATLRIENLVGDVRIERGDAPGFSVRATVTTEADTEGGARALAGAVKFNKREAGPASTLEVVLPKAQFPVIYHAGIGEGWFRTRSYVEYLGEKRRVSGDPDDAVRVRVDLVVLAPSGSRLDVRNVLGDATAQGFSGELRLDGSSGRLSSSDGEGRLVLDSGSGAVEVSTHAGEVRADTGSGAVTIRGCRCTISADTGSGRVRILGGEGSIDADTGSGEVVVEDFKGSLRADTGSGGLTASGLSEARELVADTGSGGVRVSGDLSALQRLDIDSGSGGVTLESSAWPAMDLVIETGSGSIDADLPGASVTTDAKGRRTVHTGDGGFRGAIETGSGSVRLRTVPAVTD